MNLLEKCLETIAPHVCLSCGYEGALLCGSCRFGVFGVIPSRCYRCHIATKQSRVCLGCRRKSSLAHVWVSARYSGGAKELIHRFKFERAKQAAHVIADAIDQVLPILPGSVVVAHVPTANSRVRIRGYDQAQLIARELCKRRGWRYASLLLRSGKARQVGAKRYQRLAQLESAFSVQNSKYITGAHILLVDDVLTTGATIEAAARALKQAGAKTIDAVVFAQP